MWYKKRQIYIRNNLLLIYEFVFFLGLDFIFYKNKKIYNKIKVPKCIDLFPNICATKCIALQALVQRKAKAFMT